MICITQYKTRNFILRTNMFKLMISSDGYTVYTSMICKQFVTNTAL